MRPNNPSGCSLSENYDGTFTMSFNDFNNDTIQIGAYIDANQGTVSSPTWRYCDYFSYSGEYASREYSWSSYPFNQGFAQVRVRLWNRTEDPYLDPSVGEYPTSGYSSGWSTSSALYPQITASEPTNITVSSVTQTSATVQWHNDGSTSNYTDIRCYWANPSGSDTIVWSTNNISTPNSQYYSDTATGLTAGRTYYFYVRSKYSTSSGISDWVSSATFDTLPETPPVIADEPTNITVSNITKTAATVQWYNHGSTSNYTDIICYKSNPGGSDTVAWSSNNIYTPSTQYYSDTAVGLAMDSTYYFYVRSKNTPYNGESDWVSSATFNTLPDVIKPTFNWVTTPTQNQDFNITALEWNNFTAKINELLTYHSLSTRTFTSVSAGIELTDTIFNEARDAISYAVSTTAPRVNSDDDVNASYFTQLVADLNK